jgi:putative two-component system response regulator
MAEEKESMPNILVVDDNIANVELLEAYLSASGYNVIKAYDGEEGLGIIYGEMPDLVLLDIMMPKMDGYEVCRRIKEDEKTRFIPVVMITALTELDAKIRGLDVGADDFLSKPFNRLELMARVRSLLRIKSLHDDLDSSVNIIFSLATALEAKDPYTGGHSERVAAAARELAKEAGLSEKEQGKIHMAGILHDVGKIGVREAILNKRAGLNSVSRSNLLPIQYL